MMHVHLQYKNKTIDECVEEMNGFCLEIDEDCTSKFYTLKKNKKFYY